MIFSCIVLKSAVVHDKILLQDSGIQSFIYISPIWPLVALRHHGKNKTRLEYMRERPQIKLNLQAFPSMVYYECCSPENWAQQAAPGAGLFRTAEDTPAWLLQ